MPQPGKRSRPLWDTWGPVRLREAGPSPEPPAGHTLAAGASSRLAATRRQAREGIFCSSDLSPDQMPPNVCAVGSCPCPARGHLRSCSKFPDLQQQGGTGPELPKVSTWSCSSPEGALGRILPPGAPQAAGELQQVVSPRSSCPSYFMHPGDYLGPCSQSKSPPSPASLTLLLMALVAQN